MVRLCTLEEMPGWGTDMATMIDRTQYPELNLIMWDRAGHCVPEDIAHHLYETRWRFIDENRLTPRERALIARLEAAYGAMLTA